MGAPIRPSGGRLDELDRDELRVRSDSAQHHTPERHGDRPHGGAALRDPHGGTGLRDPHGGAALRDPHGGDDRSDEEWSQAIAGVLADLGQPDLDAQPVVDLSTGEIAGYELLARFPDGPQVAPSTWFRNADRLGLATALTTRVLTHAFALRSRLPEGKFLAINVEPHLLSDPAVIHALRSLPSLDRIVIELTGHTPVRDDQALTGAVEWIRKTGGQIAVDDAGAGYAGLRQLIKIQPDIVKVDRELIANIDTDGIRRGAVSMLADLVGRMDARMLAEGVETANELQVLASIGVPLAQGWLLGRPSAPYPQLEQKTVDLVQRATSLAGLTEQVAPLVRECITVDRTVWCASNTPHPMADQRATVVIDSGGAPVGVVAREAKGTRYLAPALTVQASSTPLEVVRKAMARASCHRGVPLVCVDARGRTVGVVDVSELVDTAIATVDR